MTRLSRLLFLLLLGAAQADVWATPSVEWKTATSGGYEYRYVSEDPARARFYTLSNGLSVILSPSKKEPRIQTLIAVKAGSKTDPATHTGLAHYLEHLLFKGTDKFGTLDWEKEKPYLDQINALYEAYNSTTDEGERKSIYARIDSVSGLAATLAIPNEYDKLMAGMGAKGTNAFTSFEETVYLEDIPANAIDKYLAVQAERFRHPVFRIFHTELEAVYEEKNISLDNDGRRVIERMFALLFPNNNYGKQTTIGTVEHLKNPSLLEIQKYFDTYYVPNNMGIIMAGDFDPDVVIRKIDNAFSYMQPRPVPPYRFEPETALTTPLTDSVFGPQPESILLGFRFPGASSDDARMLSLIGSILTNGSAGLIDLNLVKQQKLLGAYAYPYILKDYSVLILSGMPGEGQSLEAVRSLLLAELEKLRQGDFSDTLITSIINNEKKDILQENERYSSRAYALMESFTAGIDWRREVDYINRLEQITKEEVVQFARQYLKDNFVAIYKKQGEAKNVVKVEKPAITPIPVNRDQQSEFLQTVTQLPQPTIDPVWVDYQKDIRRAAAGPYEILAVENPTNDLFRLAYQYETGSWSNKLLPIATEYLQYIGTEDRSAAAISEAFYRLASSFNISVGGEHTYVMLSGLQEHMEATVALFDALLRQGQADPAAWEAYKARLKKARANAKEDKNQLMRGLVAYAQYGPENPFNNELSDAELDALTAADLIAVLRKFADYPHQMLYYGPLKVAPLAEQLQKIHPAPAQLEPLPTPITFRPLEQKEDRVYFTNYDMVQTEISFLRNAQVFDEALTPTVAFFNEYFGAGMGSIVFQTIRESKALAYSTYAYYAPPSKKERQNVIHAYVGTQSDKFTDAVTAMQDLLTTLPQSEKALETARRGLKEQLATERIIDGEILFNYVSARRMGRTTDIRKTIFQQVDKLNFSDLKAFHQQEISGKKFAYCIVGDTAKISREKMQALGVLQELDKTEIFGY